MRKPERSPAGGGKRERTRRKLIEATLALVAEQGFASANLADIAERAGMTTGAIYSNFEGKAGLLYAAMASKHLVLAPAYTRGASFEAQVRAGAEALVEMLPRTRDEAKFVSEYYLYSLSDADLAGRNRAWYVEQFTAMGDAIVRGYGDQLAMSPRALVLAIQSLGLGFIEQYARTPEEVTREVVVAAYEALARGAVRPPAPEPAPPGS
jgi:AcrR family transcriptional regulator